MSDYNIDLSLNELKEKNELLKEENDNLKIHIKQNLSFGLYWENQIEKVEVDLRTNYPALKQDPSKEIFHGNSLKTHLLIEGDNLHTLTMLQYTHKNLINIIYIDPPYNTGNSDFKYNDKFVDKEDTFRHSKWLSFMNKRLKLSKDLLSSDGVIFISIDDNEYSQLKILCDDIFGENNLISTLIWKKKDSPNNTAKFIGELTEYILVYAKNKNNATFNLVSLTDSQVDKYNKIDEFGNFYREISVLKSNKGAYYRPTLYYGLDIYFEGEKRTIFPTEGNRWVYSKEVAEDLLQKGVLCIKENNKGMLSVYKKDYLENKKGVLPLNLLDFPTMKNTVATKLLKEMKIDFTNPKPVDLIKFLIKLYKSENEKKAIILDFFGGSGTTGQAVLELNKEDSGSRQFILSTNNENNICELVTYARLCKVINGYVTNSGKEIEGLKCNLKYYNTIFINKEKNLDDLKRELVENCRELLCVKEDTFNLNMNLKTNLYSFYFSNNKIICLYMDYINYLVLNEITFKFKNYTNAEKILYLFIEDCELEYAEFDYLRECGITIKPIPKKIMRLFNNISEQLKEG